MVAPGPQHRYADLDCREAGEDVRQAEKPPVAAITVDRAQRAISLTRYFKERGPCSRPRRQRSQLRA